MGHVNTKWINLVMCIDESGSMYETRDDVVGGFKKIIDEQKDNKDGKVTVSLFTFNSTVKEIYLGKDINEIGEFKYEPQMMTAMNDGIGTAIDKVGKWLYDKDSNGEEMPSKTIFVLMTDGLENASKEYTNTDIQEKIKEQTEKYSWEFIYQGCDITSTKTADDLGFKWKAYASNDSAGILDNYNVISCAVSSYLSADSLEGASFALNESLTGTTSAVTKKYEKKIGKKITYA